MEKNATKTKRVVTAEPPPATEVITVDIDPEALNCPRCHHPLAPPVFQCAAGHVVCGTCHGSLEDKDRCVSCFITTRYTRCFVPTSYSRCLALDRVLGSARVDCPNGCSVAKMLYHEKAEHQKTCLGGLQIGKNQGSVGRRMGPCGGAGGDSRMLNISSVNRVVEVVVQHGDAVDAIRVLYEQNGDEASSETWTRTWGGQGGKHSTFRLEPDEHLTSVEGHYGQFDGFVVVRSLTFVSNIRTYGPYGKEDGVHFALPAGDGGKIIGFHCKSGQFLDAIGTYVKME